MIFKRFIGLCIIVAIFATNFWYVLASSNRPTRGDSQAYSSDDWIQLRTGVTEGEEIIYAAKQIAANYAYKYMRTDYESSPRVIVNLLRKEAGFTSSVDTYMGLTEELFKDEEVKTNYYYEVIKELITNEDFNKPNINTVENNNKNAVKSIIDKKIETEGITLKTLKAIDTNKDALKALGIKSETFEKFEGLNLFIIGCDSIKSFSDKMSTLIALSENINNKRIFLKKLQKNNNGNASLKNATDKLLNEIDVAESKLMDRYFERSDKESYNTLKTGFNEEMTALGLELTGYGAWKTAIDWTGFAMNSLFGVDEICEIYLKMAACIEIEEILRKSVDADLEKFLIDNSKINAEVVIAEADYFKAVELYASDLTIEYADVVKNKGLITKVENIGNSDIKEFKMAAERVKEIIKNESFTDNEFKDLDTVIASMYKDDVTPAFWAVDYINEAKEKGLFDIECGYNHEITRAEFCRLICLMLESKGYNIRELIQQRNGRMIYSPFTDTRYSYVDNIYRLGIINGLGNDTFNPLGNITRQEAAVILRKAAEILGYTITTEPCNDNTVADWARESVEYCLANGIMYGKANSVFAPKDNINKQEAIATILWLYKNEGKIEQLQDDSNIFKLIPRVFTFTSGAGGWATVINIEDDGSFVGEYHDSDMGSTGNNYPNGTCYICNFSGKFSTPKQVDDYTYSMKLELLNIEGATDGEYYENGIKYIYSEPYGFDNADEFMIYMPGASISNLPEEFLSWSFINTQIRNTIPTGVYGIYNVSGMEGFIGEDEDSLWKKAYTFSYNSYRSELQPSYYTESHLTFWPESGAATLVLGFDWSNDNQTEFIASDYRGSGKYSISLDFNDDFSSVKVMLKSLSGYNLEPWGGSADGTLSVEYRVK